jgi:hypothetical protein
MQTPSQQLESALPFGGQLSFISPIMFYFVPCMLQHGAHLDFKFDMFESIVFYEHNPFFIESDNEMIRFVSCGFANRFMSNNPEVLFNKFILHFII